MLDTSARLLRLLALFQSRRYWSGAELCTRLEVTGRTLRRDVERLRSLGYPVNSTAGTAGGYQLGAGATLPPLLLDDDEAVAVAVGLRTAATANVTGLEEASVRALLKLEQVLPARLARRVTAMHSIIVPLANKSATVDAKLLAQIAGACRDHDRLRFHYRGRSAEASSRATEPHSLVHTGRRWYLVAWDIGRRDWRTFRVDRMEPPVALSTRFVPRKPPAEDMAAYVSKNLAYSQYPHRARVVLHAPVEKVSERVSPTAGSLEALDHHTCRLHTGAHSLEYLAVHLALIGVDFDIEEPEELIDHVRRIGELFARATRASGAEQSRLVM
jgi:predicted DNA-binding transcriptional regulator YafY